MSKDEAKGAEKKEKPESAKSPAPSDDKQAKKPEKSKDGKKEKGDEKDKKDEKQHAAPKKQHGENFRYIVRIANTDMDGEKPVMRALTSITGIGLRVAPIITAQAGVLGTKEMGEATDAEIEKLETAIKDFHTHVPAWMLNRQRDIETGQSYHMFSSDVQLKVRDDINLMKKMRCYKGLRHEGGHKVRGQRTRSNGRTGLAIGVTKATAQAAATAARSEEGGREKGAAAGGAAAAPAAAAGAKPAAGAAPAKGAAAPAAGGKPAAGGAKGAAPAKAAPEKK